MITPRRYRIAIARDHVQLAKQRLAVVAADTRTSIQEHELAVEAATCALAAAQAELVDASQP